MVEFENELGGVCDLHNVILAQFCAQASRELMAAASNKDVAGFHFSMNMLGKIKLFDLGMFSLDQLIMFDVSVFKNQMECLLDQMDGMESMGNYSGMIQDTRIITRALG